MTTENFTLPSKEELTVEELDLSTNALRAGAFHLGKYCEKPSQEYVLCTSEEKDMRKCVDYGKEVTACGLDFFRSVKATCLEEFEQYANCIDKSSIDFKYEPCRKTQAVFDECMLQQMQMTRPSYDYYARSKVLQSERPRPRGYVTPDFPDRVKPIELPPSSEIPDSKYGSRLFGFP